MVSPLDMAEGILGYGSDGGFVFLKSYGDDSSDWKNQEVICAGSFLGWPKEFYYAGLKWDERLKRDNLEYFRASECEDLRGQFDPQRLGVDLSQARALALSVRHDLIHVLRHGGTGLGSISMAILRKDFHELITENEEAKRYFGTDPVRLVYKRLIRVTIDLLTQDWSKMPASLKIAFIFDEHQKWKEAEEEYNKLKEEDAACARRMAFAGHGDDKETVGLQMADLAAYEARIKALQEDSAEDRIPFKLMARNHSIYFVGLMRKENLLKELEANR